MYMCNYQCINKLTKRWLAFVGKMLTVQTKHIKTPLTLKVLQFLSIINIVKTLKPKLDWIQEIWHIIWGAASGLWKNNLNLN